MMLPFVISSKVTKSMNKLAETNWMKELVPRKEPKFHLITITFLLIVYSFGVILYPLIEYLFVTKIIRIDLLFGIMVMWNILVSWKIILFFYEFIFIHIICHLNGRITSCIENEDTLSENILQNILTQIKSLQNGFGGFLFYHIR